MRDFSDLFTTLPPNTLLHQFSPELVFKSYSTIQEVQELGSVSQISQFDANILIRLDVNTLLRQHEC